MDARTMSPLVERVAKALYLVETQKCPQFKWENLPLDRKEFRYKMAGAAIEAMKEPTHKMIREGDANSNEAASVIYTSMIEAALKE